MISKTFCICFHFRDSQRDYVVDFGTLYIYHNTIASKVIYNYVCMQDIWKSIRFFSVLE